MPIYEYVCGKCGSHVEVIQKVGDAPLKRCQQCKGKMEKITSRTSFQLKGSGWYVTDYSGKSKSPDKKPEKKADLAASSTTPSPATTKAAD
ncbi:MAG TPA: FmdB family zinc ribbon protein [Blastocatellia bacterium]|nr:FmdB family zinc ribbon protein [Blastocatellia bacterium]